MTEGNEERKAEQPGLRGMSPRARGVFAGLISLALLVILAIAVINPGSDDDDGDAPQNPAQTRQTSSEDGGEAPPDGPELGSLSVTGFLCPDVSAADADCMTNGPVEILDATLQLEDGAMISMEGVERLSDGSYAWLNVPIGEYTLLADGLLGPAGTLARNVSGAERQVEVGWVIANQDPNQPVIVQIFFAPLEGEAAG